MASLVFEHTRGNPDMAMAKLLASEDIEVTKIVIDGVGQQGQEVSASIRSSLLLMKKGKTGL